RRGRPEPPPRAPAAPGARRIRGRGALDPAARAPRLARHAALERDAGAGRAVVRRRAPARLEPGVGAARDRALRRLGRRGGGVHARVPLVAGPRRGRGGRGLPGSGAGRGGAPVVALPDPPPRERGERLLHRLRGRGRRGRVAPAQAHHRAPRPPPRAAPRGGRAPRRPGRAGQGRPGRPARAALRPSHRRLGGRGGGHLRAVLARGAPGRRRPARGRRGGDAEARTGGAVRAETL
ncbi:MAG: hypothetical protein AVDCRST_MAG40-2873, partial [uncultured Gemmatimonadaceae bacterium]